MNIRTRQELIGNNLMDIVDDYPDQLRVIIDELVSHLNHNQLDEVEDLIVNNYGDEDYSADDVEKCIIDTNGAYAECVDRLVDSMDITEFQEHLEVKKFVRDNP
tara:strand:- start:399 stop:710 length:312 start_codon:yes stop_codon:yes gene_type:complete